MLTALERFFAGARFAAAALGLVAGYELWLLAMLCWPAGDTAAGSFAAEFRTWCFGIDPATGHVEPMLVVAMLTSPLVMAAVVLAVWARPLGTAWRTRRAELWAPAATAAAVVGTAAFLLAVTATPPETGELPFPARALRTAVPAPHFALDDQDGQPFATETDGSVRLYTAIYSRCGYTCPGILAELQTALSELTPEERAHLRTAAISLDPAHDTPEVLRAAASARGLPPDVRLLTGAPDVVEDALDRLGIERRRDPNTGVIEHANLFLLVDRDGRIAYRLSPGGRQQRWLVTALRALLAETGRP